MARAAGNVGVSKTRSTISFPVMRTTLTAKGQLVRRVVKRRHLRVARGSSVKLEARGGAGILRPAGARPLPPAKGTCTDLLALGDTFGGGVDWKRVKAAVGRRARSRDLR
jgi:hypothetical protein